MLHFTKNGNSEAYGDRIPGIWVVGEYAYIAFSLNGETNHGQYVHISKKWVQIKILQRQQHNITHVYKIFKDGNQVYSINNNDPQEFTKVTLYSSNPWSDRFDGEIGNLVVCPKGDWFILISLYICDELNI